MSIDSEKSLLREKFIENLPFEGWSASTLERASRELGFPKGYSEVLYPAGFKEFSKEFADICNKEAIRKAKENGLDTMRVSQKAEELIYQKIKLYHAKLRTKEGFKKLISYSVFPTSAVTTVRNIFSFSSEAWYEMGDRSTDFSYYTRRASFSAIYTKAALYSLDDDSQNLDKTRNYIKKSIDGLMKFHKLKNNLTQLFRKTDKLKKKG